MIYLLLGVLVFFSVNIGLTLLFRWWDRNGWF
jgi:hypothetical protein